MTPCAFLSPRKLLTALEAGVVTLLRLVSQLPIAAPLQSGAFETSSAGTSGAAGSAAAGVGFNMYGPQSMASGPSSPSSPSLLLSPRSSMSSGLLRYQLARAAVSGPQSTSLSAQASSSSSSYPAVPRIALFGNSSSNASSTSSSSASLVLVPDATSSLPSSVPPTPSLSAATLSQTPTLTPTPTPPTAPSGAATIVGGANTVNTATPTDVAANTTTPHTVNTTSHNSSNNSISVHTSGLLHIPIMNTIPISVDILLRHIIDELIDLLSLAHGPATIILPPGFTYAALMQLTLMMLSRLATMRGAGTWVGLDLAIVRVLNALHTGDLIVEPLRALVASRALVISSLRKHQQQ